MAKFTQYDPRTGEIMAVMDCPASDALVLENIVEGVYRADRYVIRDGVPVPRPSEDIEAEEEKRAWRELRKIRDGLLADTDWTQVSDAPVDKSAWASYRQQLRDLPEIATDPRSVIWPARPD